MTDTTDNNDAAALAALPGYAEARAWLARGPRQLLIDGQWVPARSGRRFETIDPATEEVLASVAEGDADDIDLAVAAARRAFRAKSWSGISPHARSRLLLKIAELMEKHAAELAVLETLNNGAPYTAALGRPLQAAETFRYYAGWPTKLQGTTSATDDSRFLYMLREPVGVCGLISAWNMPLVMAATKIAPALACGNTVVFKPAELTPLSTLRLAELMEEAGLPPGVLNVVPGYGTGAGAAISAHRDIDKVSFTGSTQVGRMVLQASAGNMKKVTLELGGKSPNIIFPDANLDRAVVGAVEGFCRNSGQICSSGTRLFVHESIHDEVVERVAALARSYKVGSPFARDTKLGPLISRRQLERVQAYVDSGREAGARLVLGGERWEGPGFFMAPTVFDRVDNGMKIAREEIFGPVLSVLSFKDEDDAVFQGNDTEYGLAAAVWTRDVHRAHRVARALQSGRVWINTYAEGDPVMSIGGYKQSGYGRELGAESIEAFTQTKSVLMRIEPA